MKVDAYPLREINRIVEFWAPFVTFDVCEGDKTAEVIGKELIIILRSEKPIPLSALWKLADAIELENFPMRIVVYDWRHASAEQRQRFEQSRIRSDFSPGLK